MVDKYLPREGADREHLTPTLRDVLAIGFRYRRLVMLCFVGIILGAVLAALVLPKYQAETKILVNRGRVDPVVAPTPEQNNPIGNYAVTNEELNSEVELLNSYEILRKVVVTCDLQHPKKWFGKVLAFFLTMGMTEDEKIDRTTGKLADGVNIQTVPKTNVIEITYASPDPQTSARVLATLNKLYLERHLAVHRPSGQHQFFEAAAEEYRNGLRLAEARLADFPREHGAVAPAMSRDLTLQKLTEFTGMWQQTQAAIADTENRIRNLQEQTKSLPSRQTTEIRNADNPELLQQLKSTLLTLELKRVELLTKYQPDYRLVQEVEKQIAETRDAIANENKAPVRAESTDVNPTHQWANSELAKASAELSGLQARAAATERIVGLYQAATRDFDRKEIMYQDLKRTATAEEGNYLLYLRKREEARITDALDEQRILNVVIAEVPLAPALPLHSPWLYGLLGGMFAALLSVGLILGLEYLDTSFRTPREVEAILGVPVLAAIPEPGKNGTGSGTMKDAFRVLTREHLYMFLGVCALAIAIFQTPTPLKTQRISPPVVKVKQVGVVAPRPNVQIPRAGTPTPTHSGQPSNQAFGDEPNATIGGTKKLA
jgi:uncharacterized protein involved in exopolysaccharide biosynthesis